MEHLINFKSRENENKFNRITNLLKLWGYKKCALTNSDIFDSNYGKDEPNIAIYIKTEGASESDFTGLEDYPVFQFTTENIIIIFNGSRYECSYKEFQNFSSLIEGITKKDGVLFCVDIFVLNSGYEIKDLVRIIQNNVLGEERQKVIKFEYPLGRVHIDI